MRHIFGAVMVALLTVLVLPVPLSAFQSTIESSADTGATVVVGGKALLTIRDRIASFSAQERATAIAARIQQLSTEPRSSVSPIQAVDYEATTEIVAHDLVIMAVTDGDAKPSGLSRQQLARQYAQVIETRVDSLRSEHSARTILLGVVYSFAVTVVMLLVLKILGVSYRRFVTYLDTYGRQRIPSLHIQQVNLVTSHQIANALIALLRVLRIAALFALSYLYVSLVFSFFPGTRGYSGVLLEYVFAPIRSGAASLITRLPDLIFIGVVVGLAYYLTKVLNLVFREIGAGTIQFEGFYRDWADPTYKIIRFVVIAITIAVILPSLPGYRSPAFQGVSIFVGVLISLSSTAAVSNIIAGLALTYTCGFQVGDRVKIGETVGDVLEKTLLVTRIRTIKNVNISIPNALVLSAHMVNFTSAAERDGLILHTTITIGYDAPWKKVHELLIEAALATENVLKEPAPFVLQTSLDDSYVSYEINAYTKNPSVMAVTYSRLHANIQDTFNRAGVEILSPAYSAIRDGNDETIPRDYRKPDYTPKAFRVSTQAPNSPNRP